MKSQREIYGKHNFEYNNIGVIILIQCFVMLSQECKGVLPWISIYNLVLSYKTLVYITISK